MIEVVGVELEPAAVIAAAPPWIIWGNNRSANVLPQARDGTEMRMVAGHEVEFSKWTKGPNGRLLCRWCRDEVPKGRQCWCSDLHQAMGYALTVAKFYRVLLLDRDNYRCVLCEVEHPGWYVYDAANPPKNRYVGAGESIARVHAGLAEELSVHPMSFSALIEAPWELDHLHPVALGGTDEPGNLRTTCRQCHGDKSRRDAAVLAKAKRIRAKHLGQKGESGRGAPRAW